MHASRRSELVPVGPAHPEVRRYLHIKRHRSPVVRGVVALEGSGSIGHAMAASTPIEAVFVCLPLLRGEAEGISLRLRTAGVPAFGVSERLYLRMVNRDGPDGVAAIARLHSSTLDGLPVVDSTTVVIANGLELLGNLGTLIRSADAAGAAAVILTDSRVAASHPLVVRASMGTVFSMPTVEATSAEAIDWLRRHRFQIVAAHPDADTSYRSVNYRGRVAVVLGSERKGLAAVWRDAADQLVAIPMQGAADSLNVAVAGALILYEVLHHRHPEL
jgi:TrmH family RNA methyltransferase